MNSSSETATKTGLSPDQTVILGHAWANLQQLAQQRFTHFNVFIIFMMAIAAIYTNLVGASTKGNLICIVLSLISLFMCFVFYKFDTRNKEIKDGIENIVANIEKYLADDNLRLIADTQHAQKTGCVFCKSVSANSLYRWLYKMFTGVSLIALIIPIIFLVVYRK